MVKKKATGDEPPEIEGELEEVVYGSSDEAVDELVSSIAQLASPFLGDGGSGGAVGAVVIVAVTPDGATARTDEIMPDPEGSADPGAQRRANAACQLHVYGELLRHAERLRGKILEGVSNGH